MILTIIRIYGCICVCKHYWTTSNQILQFNHLYNLNAFWKKGKELALFSILNTPNSFYRQYFNLSSVLYTH